MIMKYTIKAPVLAVAAVFTLSGCNLLDVNNPNSLTEESVQLPAASNGVANGSLRKVADAVSEVWQTTGVASDELFWTGSRDGWNTLDQGAIDEPRNEFLDAVFPELGTAVWMSDNALTILTQHVADNPGQSGFERDLARAYFFNGIALLITGETQEDMTFSDKMEDGAPVGPANMFTVLDDAIANLNEAVTRFGALGEDDLETAALAVRARAHMSRAIWNVLNPGAAVGGALDFGQGAVDAAAVLAAVGTEDYLYQLGFSSSASICSMCSWINLRGENQVQGRRPDDPERANNLIALTTSGTGASGRMTDGDSVNVLLLDPVSGDPDPAVKRMVDRFGVDQYGSLTLASARLMRLILAEHALATSGADFDTHINALRAFDGKAAFGDEVTDLAILQHERRLHTLFMGLRLPDMYRWGITDTRWLATNTAITAPGTMMPIGIVECRANQYLDSQTCAAVSP
jgi:hypothetical protein